MKPTLSALSLLCVLAASTHLGAQTIFLVDDRLTGPPTLVTRQADDGTVTTIGALDRPFAAIAFDSLGRLWGIEREAPSLVRIDPATAASLAERPLVWDGDPDVFDLTIDGDGTFWVLADDITANARSVFRLDPVTGTTEAVVTPAPMVFRITGLAAEVGGLLSTSAEALYRVNTNAGALELLGAFDGLDPYLHQPEDADATADGSLIAILTRLAGPIFTNSLVEIDLGTFQATHLPGEYGPATLVPRALAIQRGGAAPIPTLGGWGLALMVLMLAAGALGVLRR